MVLPDRQKPNSQCDPIIGMWDIGDKARPISLNVLQCFFGLLEKILNHHNLAAASPTDWQDIAKVNL